MKTLLAALFAAATAAAALTAIEPTVAVAQTPQPPTQHCPDYYFWDHGQSPTFKVPVPNGLSRNTLVVHAERCNKAALDWAASGENVGRIVFLYFVCADTAKPATRHLGSPYYDASNPETQRAARYWSKCGTHKDYMPGPEQAERHPTPPETRGRTPTEPTQSADESEDMPTPSTPTTTPTRLGTYCSHQRVPGSYMLQVFVYGGTRAVDEACKRAVQEHGYQTVPDTYIHLDCSSKSGGWDTLWAPIKDWWTYPRQEMACRQAIASAASPVKMRRFHCADLFDPDSARDPSSRRRIEASRAKFEGIWVNVPVTFRYTNPAHHMCHTELGWKNACRDGMYEAHLSDVVNANNARDLAALCRLL